MSSSPQPLQEPDSPARGGSLEKSYSPGRSEPAVREAWRRARCFHAEPGGDAEPFTVLIPPPNVTGALHLGHGLNNTLQDVVVRWRRMLGRNTLWMPGTDHAGIATQSVVEKRLLREGRRRQDLGREAFIELVQAWKDEYEARIVEQLERLGCSCDFERTRFTMDPVCTEAVRAAFFELFRQGLVYRGKRLVNWDPASGTALADDEVEMRTVAGAMHELRYPLEDGSGFVTVATTRPETMLGDTAVAVNPRDPRATELRGKWVTLPIVGRRIPIVEDEFVVLPVSLGGDPADPKALFATGFLKVTPAHDPNDWEIGRRHGLEVVNVLGPDGAVSDRHGWHDLSEESRQFVGMPREDARRAIVEWFRRRGLLGEVKPYEHAVGHSYRSHVPIEPYLSDQWYVRVTDPRLSGAALRAMAPDQVQGELPAWAAELPPRRGDGELRFHPPRYARTFQTWHENLRDWCISRQLWWGHRIPVWSRRVELGAGGWEQALPPQAWAALRSGAWRAEGAEVRIVRVADGSEIDPLDDRFSPQDRSHAGEHEIHVCLRSDDSPLRAELERHGFDQDPDVLDTWFSSALWPLSTMGWPDPEAFPETAGLLETFNPSSVLFTAREIITLWVSRMVMFNRFFRGGDLPFREVIIHAMIQDGHGQKMSKSLGNGFDPLDIVESHGADALRFTLVQLATSSQDVRIPVDMVCPHTGEVFAPPTTTTPAGHLVASPRIESPSAPGRFMTSVYGALSGLATPSDSEPLARNTSSRFDQGRNFANKLWNATRFAIGILEAAPASGPQTSGRTASLADRWILSALASALERQNAALAGFQFHAVAESLYDFAWRDFCDWYLEAIKPTVREDPRQRQVLRTVLEALLRMLHPVCPFVTETLHAAIRPCGPAGLMELPLADSPLLATAAWPRFESGDEDPLAASAFERVRGLVSAIRTLRGERNVPPRRRIRLLAPEGVRRLIADSEGLVEHLAGVESVDRLVGAKPPTAAAIPFEGEELWLDGLVDAADLGAERARLERLISERERAIDGFERKLGNPGYLAKAKRELVEETRSLHAAAVADLEAARRSLAAIGG
jgi:valyl-tRNA synthetase